MAELGNGNGRRGWDLLEARLPLRTVVQMLVMVVMVWGAAWAVASSFKDQVTGLKGDITDLKGTVTVLTNRIDDRHTANVDRLAGMDKTDSDLKTTTGNLAVALGDLTARFSNFKRFADTAFCQHWATTNCEREP